jgi:hypothetical protein
MISNRAKAETREKPYLWIRIDYLKSGIDHACGRSLAQKGKSPGGNADAVPGEPAAEK